MSRMDPGELGRWFDAHGARLVLYARQWLPDGGAAEDVVQDVFARLLADAGSVREVRAWLYRAVRNAAISRTRSEKARAGREQHVARPAWFQPHGDELIDARAAEAALQRLSLELREIVVLRIWGQLTLAEAAETVGMPLSTCHERYRLALSMLRSGMESTCRNKPIGKSKTRWGH